MAGLFDGIEEISFKQVEGGYIFETPPPWVFGTPRAYFVTATQKAEIAERIRQTLRGMKSLVLAGWFGFLLAYFGAMFWLNAHDYANSLTVFVLTLAISLPYVWLIHSYRTWRLRPLIAGLPRSNARIGAFDRARLLGANASIKFLVVGLISSVIGFVGMLQAVLGDRQSGYPIMDLFSLAACGLMAVYFASLVIIRKRTRNNAS